MASMAIEGALSFVRIKVTRLDENEFLRWLHWWTTFIDKDRLEVTK